MTIVDAATGLRERVVDAKQLHPYPVGPRGGQHRRGYVHTATRGWAGEHLADRALRGHPFTIAGSSIARGAAASCGYGRR
ncbi:hypothetical protein [Streptomyces sp. NPDC002746]